MRTTGFGMIALLLATMIGSASADSTSTTAAIGPRADAGGAVLGASQAHGLIPVGRALFGDVYCRKMLTRCDAGNLSACALFERFCAGNDDD